MAGQVAADRFRRGDTGSMAGGDGEDQTDNQPPPDDSTA
jgi:hypothetical protein